MSSRRRIAVITGTRAEFGLLRTIMRAIAEHPSLQLQVMVTGTHLLGPAFTREEVAAEFDIHSTIPMQEPSEESTMTDAHALGRGVIGFAEVFAREQPDVVVVLGDRIEALAACLAASLSAIRVAHIHGGDRAEGIADEGIRHAISKLSHLHFPATTTSAARLVAMGEEPARVHVVGSPAVDGLEAVPPLSNERWLELNQARIIMMLHPTGNDPNQEYERARQLIRSCSNVAPTLIIHPNHDRGRDGIMRAITESSVSSVPHLRRNEFIGLLRRAAALVGNSSAGLIEAAAVPIRCINCGTRQAGREKPFNVIDVPDWNYGTIQAELRKAVEQTPLAPGKHPYGDGTAGRQIAEALATFDAPSHAVRKINTY